MGLRVGLTGGIASGKTTVSRLFARLGVPIIDTDVIARDVVAPGTPLLQQVDQELGPGLIGPDGALRRRQLRERVFSDPDARRRLEALLHPAIRAEVARQSAQATVFWSFRCWSKARAGSRSTGYWSSTARKTCKSRGFRRATAVRRRKRGRCSQPRPAAQPAWPRPMM
jgi:hypothetical protein